MPDWIDRSRPRRLCCPYCGQETVTYSKGAVYCGPHRHGPGDYSPAVRMVEAWEPSDATTDF